MPALRKLSYALFGFSATSDLGKGFAPVYAVFFSTWLQAEVRTVDTPNIRRIAIIGAGPMGCSLAAVCAATKPTSLVEQNAERVARIRDGGIRLAGEISAQAHPEIVGNIEDLANVPDLDLVFIATKTSSIKAVCRQLRPFLPKTTTVCSYQNGFEPGRAVIKELNTLEVIRMLLHYGARFVEPRDGTGLAVEIVFNTPPHFVGALRNDQKSFCEAVAKMLSDGGLFSAYTPEIELEIWKKSLLNAAMNPVSALTDTPMEEVMRSPARVIVEQLLREGLLVAQAEGFNLGEAYYYLALRYLENAGPHLTSMTNDIRHGLQSEVEQLNHQIVEKAARRGIAVPTHVSVLALIETFDWKVRRKSGGPQIA
jgi:2-dehydropantoate 2-reductase